MTPAFAQFTRQYHLTGREKADGYDWTAFAGLADDEKPVVFDMLEQELPWASDWFFALDPARALVVAQRIEPGLRGRSGAHWLQQQIVRYSGDLRYQRHMMEDYPRYADRNRAQVIDSLAATPANSDTIAFFKQVVTTEAEHDAVFRAGWALLSALGVPGSTEPEQQVYHRILDGFRQPELAARLAALAQLAPYEAQWHKRQTLVGAVAAALDRHPARQHYAADLADYARRLDVLAASGTAPDVLARQAWTVRREVDVKLHAIMPAPLRDYIRRHNLTRYLDPYGPSFERLMVSAARKTPDACQTVLALSLRPPVRDERLLSDFATWLLQQDAAYLDAALQQLEGTYGR